ncbi:MAG: ADP-ribosylglycohydrolase family protein [Acaryochloris sp. RU_4_1]|nr:ADP-ribosylglycohydrolase family protein [Acaryochloris sp. SU_5_25]NJM67665.1 ADP-ribosylglycohydrolase family protein [Acaryochloris sp. RU_4_1]NJR56397.1 ADP-ribosylglycohydrolase family protein [Acaryochloris sp. CRU_2_0]
MLGAIAGDIIGSIYEFDNHRHKKFPLFSDRCFFTDDTVLTVAVADALLHGSDYVERFKHYYRLYPHAGYGARFHQWVSSTATQPYNSWGNGSAMRVSPVGFAFDDLDTVLAAAATSAAVTHNHPEGVKGAQATAAAIFLGRTGHTKVEIRRYIETTFAYDLGRSLDQIRPVYKFNESCQETVPEAIIAFLESTDFEDAIRNAVSLGGDTDTLACITGGIAEAFYGGVPDAISSTAMGYLNPHLREVTMKFFAVYRNLSAK